MSADPGAASVRAGRVVAVNLVHELRPDPHGDVARTAIDKRSVGHVVRLDLLGPVGDTVMDRRAHGGPDQAVYAYAQEDLDAWAAELGRDLRPGMFGENLTTTGVAVTGAVVGERWRVGTAELVVRMPRTPCRTFQDWLGEPHWVKRFTDHGAPGAYLSVDLPGEVAAGSEVVVLDRPAHGVTIGEVFAGRATDPDRLRVLLNGGGLAAKLEASIRKTLAVAAS